MSDKSDKPKKPIRKFAPMRQISMSKTYGENLTLREFKGCNVNGSVIIECFSPAEHLDVGQIAAEYIIRALDLPLIGDIISDSFTPLTIIVDGIPSSSARIYGNKHIVIFVSNYTLKPEMTALFIKALFEFATRHDCSMIMSMKAIDLNPVTEKVDPTTGQPIPPSKEEVVKMLEEAKKKTDEKLMFLTNDEDFANKMIKMEHKPVSDLTIGGIAGGILAEAQFSSVPVACLFSPISGAVFRYLPVDGKASIILLRCISDLLGGKIDLGEAFNKLHVMEDTMLQLLQSIEQSPMSTTKGDQYQNMWI